ncbi:MAG TPA: AMP-binding protein, partial [Casimicrobiaceae bacterium]|nr:AMP-binding protein [Casimicrobiaceae bacterium]
MAAAASPMDAFDGRADDYARHRFDYAPEAIDAIVAIAGLDRSSVIADLGAGTGMLSRHFAERAMRVYAVEPNDDMRALAVARHPSLGTLHVIAGSAHATGLPDASVDVVTAGRAIQWFDPVPSQAEIRRILRPGGWLVVVRTPVTDAYSLSVLEGVRAICTTRAATSGRHQRAEADALAYFGSDNCIRLTFPQTRRETWPQFLGRLQSLSYAPRAEDPEHAAFVQRARELFEAAAVDGAMTVAYATQVLMKRLAAPPVPRAALPFDEREIDGDIVARFERVVDRVGESIAIHADGVAWRYADLDARANDIAERVLRASPDRARPVALLFDHGAAGIAAMLGVLKAGRAFSALAPAHPAERQRDTLADLGSTLLLCDAGRWNGAQAIATPGLAVKVVDLSALPGRAPRPRVDRSASDVAGIYYTSGTTGAPKGIALSHRYFLHRVWLSAPMLAVAPGDRCSQVPGIAFVSAASDITIALLSGATLCPFDANRHGLAGLAAWLRDERIAILRMPVALLQQFVGTLGDGDVFPHVRILHPAGRLEGDALRRFRRHFPGCRVLRQLASTEASVIASTLQDADVPDGAVVPVGHPVPGKDLWLEKEDGALAGVGEVGEIVVRSRYLFAGLWGRPDTWVPAGEARVHRTGDLGRWRPGCVLEFVGRIDARVKIRGFTVDCEHVEAALLATGRVAAAAVVARDDDHADATLVAYVVPKDADTTPATLRASLALVLPAPMVPSRFVTLDALPTTATGKVHRAALAARPLPRTASTGGAVAP